MKILHTMLRVGDLDRSVAFYTNALGMKELRRREYPDGKFTLAFLGYQSEADTVELELTYNWGVDKYELGDAYGHIAIEVDSAAGICERVRKNGGEIVKEPFSLRPGGRPLAFAKDPDGYFIEFIQKV